MKSKNYNVLYVETGSGYIGKIIEWQEITVQASTRVQCREELSNLLYEKILSYQQQGKELPEGYGDNFLIEKISFTDEIDKNFDIESEFFDMAEESSQQESSVNQFALNFYATLEKNQNVFFSPYSIAFLLMVLSFGAKGATQEQIIQVLQSDTNEDISAEIMQLMRALESINKRNVIQIYTANALYVQTPVLLDKFKQLMHEYDITINLVDFINNKVVVVQQINDWCAEKTRGKITKLLEPDLITDLTRLVISNAIYFKAEWDVCFEHSMSAIFHLSAQDKIKVPMMKRMETSVRHLGTTNLQLLRLDYRALDESPSMSMIILLPKQIDGLAALEQKLTPFLLRKWILALNANRPKTMDIYMPTFTINAKIDLHSALKQLGMNNAFDKQADFSEIDGTKQLHIKHFLHQSFITVNEIGVEAGAVSMVDIDLECCSEETCTVNHPFLFLIMENSSGVILFMGRVVNPLLESAM